MTAIAESLNKELAPSFQPKIIRSTRRQSLAIEIKYGEVIIRAPAQLPLTVINKFISSRKQWIQKILNSGVSQPRHIFRHGAQIYLNGSLVLVCFQEGRSGCELIDCQLNISIPGKVINRDHFGLNLFNKWLKEQATEIIPDLVEKYAKHAELHHRLTATDFKYTRSKWGHCTSSGHIQINPRILMAPIAAQCYLIAHEVAHLKWMNHSVQFWNLVENLDPEYKIHRKWLQTHQHQTLALTSNSE